MLNRFIAVRDRNISLWQSAVDEVTAKLADPARMKAMREAAALHALASIGKAVIPDQPPSAESVRASDPQALAFLSKAFFDNTNSEHPQHASAVPFSFGQLTALVREYSTADVLGWAQCAINYAKYLWSGSGTPTYVNWQDQKPPTPSFGVLEFRLPAKCKVLMLGDWGARMTDNVAMLRQALKRFKPDAIIHLGDVYYSGTQFECKRNVLDVMDQLVNELGLQRPPFFAIPGNHEYYSGGAGFYEMIGQLNSGIAGARQQASYFCLRTQPDQWQFLAMDTGYNDHIPGLPVGPGLQPSEITWHRDKLEKFAGSTILLSHHQLFSANSEINKGARPYVNESLLATFSPYFDRVAAWFWGHEHNFVLFEDGQHGLKRGRLIGCSSYEESLDEDPYRIKYNAVSYIQNMPQLELSPYRSGLQKYYNHACALLELSGSEIEVSYFQYPSWDQDFMQPEPPMPDPFYREQLLPTR